MKKYDPVVISKERFDELSRIATDLRTIHKSGDCGRGLEDVSESLDGFLDDVSQASSMQWAAVDKQDENRHWHVYNQADSGAFPNNTMTFSTVEDAHEEMWSQWDEAFGGNREDGPVADMPFRFSTNGVDVTYVESHDDPDCELWNEFLVESAIRDGIVPGEPR